MTPNDKKIAHCTNCEFYYDKIESVSSPLGWCRNGYGRAIHTLVMCPKLAAKVAARKEKEASAPKTTTKPFVATKKPFRNKTAKKRTPLKDKPAVTVVVKAKKVMETGK